MLYDMTKHPDSHSASYYAFGPDIPIQSQYEINFYVRAIGKEHEAELAREAEQRAASKT